MNLGLDLQNFKDLLQDPNYCDQVHDLSYMSLLKTCSFCCLYQLEVVSCWLKALLAPQQPQYPPKYSSSWLLWRLGRPDPEPPRSSSTCWWILSSTCTRTHLGSNRLHDSFAWGYDSKPATQVYCQRGYRWCLQDQASQVFPQNSKRGHSLCHLCQSGWSFPSSFFLFIGAC